MVKTTTILALLISISSYSQCSFIKYDTVGCDKVTMDIDKFTYYYKCEKNLSIIRDTLIYLKMNNELLNRKTDSVNCYYSDLIKIKNVQIKNEEIKRKKTTVKLTVVSSLLAILLILTNI
jgi:ABC-type anion transport system duplicated permease subunit